MKLVSDFRIGRLYDAEVGDLVRFTMIDGTVLAIVMNKRPTQGVLLGVLPLVKGRVPSHILFTANSKCMNYGADWAVEPVVQPGSPERSSLVGTAGVLHVSKDDASLCFARGANDFDAPDEIEWGLRSVDIVELPSAETAVPFVEWRLWGRDRDVRDPNAKPLYVFSHTEAG